MPAVYPLTDDAVKYLIKQGVFDAAGGYRRTITPKTGDYTIDPAVDPSGTIFTNRGASGAVNFTLPAPSRALAGVEYHFVGIADQNITVTAPTADTLVVLNDAAADSLAMSTSSQKIGGAMHVVCDGTAWIAWGEAVGITFTVAT